ncbi:hypothetical protein QU24_04295 [Pantoea rodasii]|uniref:Cell envelope integrity protein TolA n=1 Tax=Pantoea rodasii TaxID=1076549 RepID=A0A0B1R8C2_9GAMM|nr:cell envelope integrity TolA C-terminal domain-containing protein [Pantoea rodasii]KHJ69268.1 hypothetical protein QU24_04295 [Pantoea rodasii]
MKKMTLLGVIILSACQIPVVTRPLVIDDAFMHPGDAREYVINATQAIRGQSYETKLYRGKICHLHVHQEAGKLPDSVRSEVGDTAFCAAAVSSTKLAISKMEYPFRPAVSDGNTLNDDIRFIVRADEISEPEKNL